MVAEYLSAGMKLIPIKFGTKLPLEKGWHNKTYDTPELWAAQDVGVAVHLGASDLISLDVDSPKEFERIAEDFGLEIPKTLKIIGKNYRYIFRSKNKIYRSLSFDKKCIFEIRAGNHYDLLPPSIHPDTGTEYTSEGDVSKIANAPGWMESLVVDWDAIKPQLISVLTGTDDLIKINYAAPQESVSAEYCKLTSLTDNLEKYGYLKKSFRRWLSPCSKTKIAGVYIVDDQRCWIHHASDPLCSNDSGRPVNAFDLCVQYEHGGDYKAAYKVHGNQKDVKPKGRPRKELAPPEAPIEAQELTLETQPFRFLGHDGGSVFVLPRAVGSVVEIKIASMKKMHLIQIAPLDYWLFNFPSKTSIDWDSAFNFLVENSYATGLFDPSKIRGIGAWYDNKKTVIHCGKTIIENGVKKCVTESTGHYIYERKNGLSDISEIKADDQAAQKITELLGRFNFENDYDARLLAGWIALAPICGALEWRPHVWLSAARGSGKTWIQSNILSPLVGDIGLSVQGSTTEAGLRQHLASDARPVLFDEAESDTVGAQERMQKIIEFARQASSDSSAHVVKGTKDGACIKYLPRSMFLMSSINSSLRQSADLSRFTTVNLKGKTVGFKTIDVDTGNLLTPEFCAAFRRRMFDMIPTVRSNAKKISEKIAELKNDRRLGDQLGALIAGYVATQHEELLTDDEGMVFAYEFSNLAQKEEPADEADEMQVLNFTLQSRIRSENIDRTIGELVQIATYKKVDDKITETVAKSYLARWGVRIDKGELLIANNNAELKKIMVGSPWQAGWKHLLARIEGARKGDFPIDFAGSRQRYVAIKMEVL